MKKLIIMAAVVVLGMASVAACGGGESEDSAPTAEPAKATPQATAAATTASASELASGDDVVKVVNEDPGGSGEYQFSQPELTFSVGDTVTFQVSAESFEADSSWLRSCSATTKTAQISWDGTSGFGRVSLYAACSATPCSVDRSSGGFRHRPSTGVFFSSLLVNQVRQSRTEGS